MRISMIFLAMAGSFGLASGAQAHFAFEKYTVSTSEGLRLTMDFGDKFLTKDIKEATVCLAEGKLAVTSARMWKEEDENSAVMLGIGNEEREQCVILDVTFHSVGRWSVELELNGGDSASFELDVNHSAKKEAVAAGKEIYLVYSREIGADEQFLKICNAFHGKFLQVQLMTDNDLLDLEFVQDGHACIVVEGFYVDSRSEMTSLLIALDGGDFLQVDYE